MDEKWFKGLTPLMVSRCSFDKSGLDYSVFLKSDDIVAASEQMYRRDYFLEDVTAADAAEGCLLTYHFSRFAPGERIALRILAEHGNPEVPSISHIFQGADWHERECYDFFRVTFKNHPNLLPLLLDAEAEGGVLVKDSKERAVLSKILPKGEVVYVAEGFTLLDAAEVEAAEPAE